MSVERPPMPTEERRPAWRRACLAYREMRQAGASDQQAHEAAAYATRYHPEWFWQGMQHVGKWRRSHINFCA